MKQNFIIALDGPAATGKGTLARALAHHYHLPHLDTGLTYRAVAFALLAQNLPLTDADAAIHIAHNIDINHLDRSILSAHYVGDAASKISVISEVRRILVEKQREFAQNPIGAVLDGRDIGTIVCPEAHVKFYITADPKIRAMRRFHEEKNRNPDADFDAILHDILTRDERDMTRADSPLKPAQNAHLLDTSNKSIESVFLEAVAIVEKVIASLNT